MSGGSPIRLGGKERRIPAAVIGGVELLFMGAVLGWLFYLGSSRLLAQARLFMVRLPEWLSEADRILTGLFLSLEEKMGLMPESLVGLARELVRDASEAVRQASLPLLMTNSVSVLALGGPGCGISGALFCGRSHDPGGNG